MARTVLLVDDHAPFRAVAWALLQLNGFAVVGEALGGLPAMEPVGRLRPNVVLLDLRLPDFDGFEVAPPAGSGGHAAVVGNRRCILGQATRISPSAQ